MISELTSAIEEKSTIDDYQAMLKDYVLKSDHEKSLSTKASIHDVQSLLDAHENNSNKFKQEINSIYDKIDILNTDLNRKLAEYVHQQELETLKPVIEAKADVDYVHKVLEVIKQSVSSALQKKAGLSELEALLQQRVNIQGSHNCL